MSTMGTILEILKYILPSLVVLIAANSVVRKFLNAAERRQQLKVYEKSKDVTLRLRLQAYERLVLFLERINPRLIIPRVYDPSMTVLDLRTAIVMSINAEFEHNLAQQVYVSPNLWSSVRTAKEQELSMINHISDTLNPDAPARELHIRILEVIAAANTDLPSEMAINVVNAEARELLQ